MKEVEFICRDYLFSTNKKEDFKMVNSKDTNFSNEIYRKEENSISEFYVGNKFSSYKLANYLLKEENIIYVNNVGFYYFNDYWKHIEDSEIAHKIVHILKDKFNAGIIRDTIYLMQNEAARSASILNSNRNRIALLNGTLDIEDWENPKFYENEYFKGDFTTIQLNVRYNEEAKYPQFSSFLEQTFGNDREIISCVQEIMGYCLTTSTEMEKMFIFYGSGANGKSVLIDVIRALLTPQNTCSLSLSEMKNGFAKVKMMGKLLNVSSEFEGRITSSEDIKRIVSGETIDAAYKFKDNFDFTPYCKVISSTNNYPVVTDRSDAFYRRLIVIPFNYTVPEENRNKRLSIELIEELDGILLFALEGLKRLRQQNMFTQSKTINKMVNEFKKSNNNVIQFFENKIEFEEESYLPIEKVYYEYSKYCVRNGIKKLSKENMAKEIFRNYTGKIEKVRKRIGENGNQVNCYLGIKLVI